MGDKTGIAWTDATANVAVGCDAISPGCANCYAARLAATRLKHTETYKGLAVMTESGKPQWTGNVRLVLKAMKTVLGWQKPRRIFLTAQGDPFHEGFTDEHIAAMFGLMAACPQHTFQVLTKRADRMLEWFDRMSKNERKCTAVSLSALANMGLKFRYPYPRFTDRWPLRNVWLGVTVETQSMADERIPLLMKCPAEIRFLSCEPLLEPVVLPTSALGRHFLQCRSDHDDPEQSYCTGCTGDPRDYSLTNDEQCDAEWSPSIDWVIIGGESGPRARVFDVEWARALVRQCKDKDTACFVKQLGANPIDSRVAEVLDPQGNVAFAGKPDSLEVESARRDGQVVRPQRLLLEHSHGGDMNEKSWPDELKVRQFPVNGQR